MAPHATRQHALSSRPAGGGASRSPARIQSVERAALILRAVAAASGPAASATALAEAVGLNRTTAWRILATLEQQRLVRLDRDTGWYTLGFGLVDLAAQAGAALAHAARGVLQRIAAESGETAALAVRRDGQLVYVAEATAGAVVSASWQGRSMPLHATSTGKALLAWSEPDDLRRLLDLPPRGGRLPRYTASTITSLSALTRELVLTRARTYAVCRGEFEISAWGVSAPVLDVSSHPVAVVSVWGPRERLTDQRFEALGAMVVRGARELAERPV